MSAEWIAKRRELLDAATEGPWLFGKPGDDMAAHTVGEYLAAFARDPEAPATNVWLTWAAGSSNPVVSPAVTGDGPTSLINAAFIADARTSLPRALDALEAVLALTWYDGGGSEYAHVDYCGGGDIECPACWARAVRDAINDALGVEP